MARTRLTLRSAWVLRTLAQRAQPLNAHQVHLHILPDSDPLTATGLKGAMDAASFGATCSALQAMADSGFVSTSMGAVRGKRVVMYAITESGRGALAGVAENMDTFAARIRQVLAPAPQEGEPT